MKRVLIILAICATLAFMSAVVTFGSALAYHDPLNPDTYNPMGLTKEDVIKFQANMVRTIIKVDWLFPPYHWHQVYWTPVQETAAARIMGQAVLIALLSLLLIGS